MDTTTLLIAVAIVVIVLAGGAAAFVVMRRRGARAYRPMPSYGEDRTFVGIGARPPASDATMVGPMVPPPAAPRSEATVVDVRATPPPPPSAPPPPVATAAASEAPTVVMAGQQAEEAIAPTIRIPKLRARLTVTKGGSGTHELEAREYMVGRSSHADIVLADPSVSGHHAKLTLHGDAFAVVDLGSTNGTTVDGHPVQGSYVLRGGETIGFGEARARYERAG